MKFPPPPLIGNAEIEAQHIELVNIINLLVDSSATLESRWALLSKFGLKLTEHFADEAKHMQESKFPFMGTHLVEHVLLTVRFNEIYESAVNNKLTEEQLFELANDTVSHIEHYDVLYAEYDSAMSKSIN